jgi:nucleotidyltransferase/DNA polymerase involved in DNA repair
LILPALNTVQWLFLDLHAFFASCEQQENSALRGQPVIVVQTMTASAVAIAAGLLGSAQRSELLSLEEFGHSPSAVRSALVPTHKRTSKRE